MNGLRITLDSLPRILRRELDPGADALNGWDEDEIPKAPKLKTGERAMQKLGVLTAEQFREKQDEDNSIDAFKKSSSLANPLLTNIELTPPANTSEHEYYERWIKPKLLKFLWVVREGLTHTDAAKLLGWKPEKVEAWIAHNTYNLAVCVDTAKLENKVYHVSRVNGAHYGYQASAWMLERKYKDEYSKELKITTKTENENSQVIKFGDREIHF